MKVVYRWTGQEIADAAGVTPEPGSRLKLISLNDMRFEVDCTLGPEDALVIEIESTPGAARERAKTEAMS